MNKLVNTPEGIAKRRELLASKAQEKQVIQQLPGLKGFVSRLKDYCFDGGPEILAEFSNAEDVLPYCVNDEISVISQVEATPPPASPFVDVIYVARYAINGAFQVEHDFVPVHMPSSFSNDF